MLRIKHAAGSELRIVLIFWMDKSWERKYQG